ncbi:MAG TPA: hypothetical protein VD837_06995 [Terriglobales bacterium]|nr:hypothetical protein [Terriglobales bacterium]
MEPIVFKPTKKAPGIRARVVGDFAKQVDPKTVKRRTVKETKPETKSE